MLPVVKENVVERTRICVIRASMLEAFKIITNDTHPMAGRSDIFKSEMIVLSFIFHNIGVSHLLGTSVNKHPTTYILLTKNRARLPFSTKSFFCISRTVWATLKEGLH